MTNKIYVQIVDKIKQYGEENVWDIEVEDNHTYYVVDKNTEEYVLSHNCDGAHIRLLLLALFYKFAPKILKDGRVKFLLTPMITAYNKKGGIEKLFFNFNDYINEKIKYDSYFYSKGLGTWSTQRLKDVFEKFGLEKFLITFQYTPETDKLVNDWLAKDTSDTRKNFIRGISFNIEKA